MEKIENVAYKLKLPSNSRIHHVFHASCLKKKVDENVQAQNELPKLHERKEEIIAQPQVVLDWQIRKHNKEVLIHWMGLSPSYAT